MLFLLIQRVRFDLGSDDFVEVHDASGKKLLTAKNGKALALKFNRFLDSRNGQVIEIEEVREERRIQFDTADSTMWVSVESDESDVVSGKEMDDFLNNLSEPRGRS